LSAGGIIVSTGERVRDADNLIVNPGGSAMAFYIGLDGRTHTNPSSPYIVGTNLFTAAASKGNGGFPVYEFSILKSMVDPFGMGSYQFSVGTEDQDDSNRTDMQYLGFGTYYTGPKQDWNNNPWDNPLYYPTYNLVEQVGGSLMP